MSGTKWFSRLTMTGIVVTVSMVMFPALLLLKVSEAVALAWVFAADCLWQVWDNKTPKVANAKTEA